MVDERVTIKIFEVLDALESEMRELGLWDDVRPHDDALKSKQPFCCDTLKFEQWLQWIFIPRIGLIIRQGLKLPAQSQIKPMAEEYFRGRGAGKYVKLIGIIDCFDKTIEN